MCPVMMHIPVRYFVQLLRLFVSILSVFSFVLCALIIPLPEGAVSRKGLSGAHFVLKQLVLKFRKIKMLFGDFDAPM